MPTVVTEGAASAKGYGFTQAAAAANYIEDVFSTYLYTGNGSTQTITNGIDLSTQGGLVWLKSRSAAEFNNLTDTARGVRNSIYTNSTVAQENFANAGVTAFNSNGFTLGSVSNYSNTNGATYVSWTFRKQPKFFDVVTYTGDGTSNRSIPHSLGVVPGMVIVKQTNVARDWAVSHRSLSASNNTLILNSTAQQAATSPAWWGAHTATNFIVGNDVVVNANGGTYVAYLFAHNAGGFGASGTDNVISCGSVTSDVNRDVAVTLGWEPQWVLFKRINAVGDWNITDSMRGLLAAVTGTDQPVAKTLAANAATAENNNEAMGINATGFREGRLGTAGDTYIYVAIRRGPMRTPTDATKVFSPIATTAATGTKLTTSFPVDLQIFSLRTGTTNKGQTVDRLRGVSANATESGAQLITTNTSAETTTSIPTRFWDNTGFQMPSSYGGTSEIFWNFGRAPGFFDVVCYTGTGVARTVNHNLGVTPEMMIVKIRSGVDSWNIYHSALGNTKRLWFDNGTPNTNVVWWNNTSPTASVFTVGTDNGVNLNTSTFVAYLFATCPGVSKVGSYTGNGTNQTINCGFAAGARFILIKRTDSTGDWYVWDTARGIVAANDPHLSLNTTAAEVTTDDSIDPDNSGFIVNQLAATNINVNTATYIFLAIA